MVVGVLRVSKVRAGGAAYYLEVAEKEQGTGIEAPGRWMGEGTPELGLAGVVAAAEFEAVLAGEDPVTGRVLGVARPRVTVAGFDLTFSAPKSVSLLHALGDPEVSEAVAAGHAGAVGAAVSYVEDHALAVRRRTVTAPVVVPTAVGGLAAAGFVHRMSRALDPHLHTHVVVANVGRGPEGDWSALDGRGVYAHASAVDALYHCHLRHELTTRLGVTWDSPDRGRADITGIGPEVRREFSRRASQIATHLAERELSSGRARTVASFATRAGKDPLLGADDLRSQWRDRARTVGLGPPQLDAVLDRAPLRPVPPGDALGSGHPGGLDEEVTRALGDLRRAVARRDVVGAWARSLPAGAPGPAVEEAADRLLVDLAPESGPRGERQGPGVAERRYASPSLTPERDRRADIERGELSRLLAGRAIGLDRSDHGRRPLDRDRDLGVGLG
ncbi:MAG TPA: MobF family relaxase [Acidimicrobiales bacterium]|nr:MobF family relaxase [Acidimicrobiales bacterium]